MKLFTIIESDKQAHFNFGGFYHTVHEDVIDSNVECMNTIEINDCGVAGWYEGTHFVRKEEEEQDLLIDTPVKNFDFIYLDDYLNSDSDSNWKEFYTLIDVDYNSSQKNYCNALLDAIDTKFKTNFQDCFVRIWSPDYYNYNNDSILIDLTKLNNAAKNLVYNVKKQKKLENYLNDFNNLLELEFEVDYKVIN